MKAALLARCYRSCFLHACTPARCALSRALLGSAPAGSLPNTLKRFDAYALVSSLIAGGISWLSALCSWLLDLTSPNAKRHTARRSLAFLAPRSSLVPGSLVIADYASCHSQVHLCCRMNHNTPESFPLVPARCQCSQPALQTSSQPVNENGLIAHGLIDGTSRTENRPTGLSVALNGRWYTGTHLLYDSIHNCWLCMLKWVENGKNATSIFSVFNRIKTGPYLAEFVKRVHDLDKLSKIWHSRPVVNTVARLLIVGLSAAVAKTGRGEEEVTRAPLNTVAVLSLVFSLAYASPSVNRDASNTTVEFKVVRPCK